MIFMADENDKGCGVDGWWEQLRRIKCSRASSCLSGYFQSPEVAVPLSTISWLILFNVLNSSG